MLYSIDILSAMKNAKMINLFRFGNVLEMPMSVHFTICMRICCLSDVLDVPVCECQYLQCQWESLVSFIHLHISENMKKQEREKKKETWTGISAV